MRKAIEMKAEALALAASIKGEKTKKSDVEKAVKKLTKAKYDALPKALQKELKEFR